MKRAYVAFNRKGTFDYNGRCAVDVADGEGMKEIWMKLNDFLFAEYVVKEREYSDDEWKFELLSIEGEDPEPGNDDDKELARA